MVTLQEWLDKKYPTKEEREKVEEFKEYKIYAELVDREELKIWEEIQQVEELDLSDYVGLKHFEVNFKKLKKLTLGTMPNLLSLWIPLCLITSVDFLNTLSNPEKLITLRVNYDKKIEPTDIAIFSRFIGLKELQFGKSGEVQSCYYRGFYGSLKTLKTLKDLEHLCIEGLDIKEGLEYLPIKLSQRSKYKSATVMVFDTYGSSVQEQLRPFNYDLETWQLAHPEKMLISRPELFTNADSKDKWLNALKDKIINTQQELDTVKQNEQDKLSKIARLETKIQELELAKSTISQQTQTEFTTQNKGTQTDLTASQITKLEQQNEQLLKLLQATEQELNNTKQQLQKNQELNTEETKQLQSKIKLLEQQKETYQTKYDKSIEFIKEVRNDLVSE